MLTCGKEYTPCEHVEKSVRHMGLVEKSILYAIMNRWKRVYVIWTCGEEYTPYGLAEKSIRHAEKSIVYVLWTCGEEYTPYGHVKKSITLYGHMEKGIRQAYGHVGKSNLRIV